MKKVARRIVSRVPWRHPRLLWLPARRRSRRAMWRRARPLRSSAAALPTMRTATEKKMGPGLKGLFQKKRDGEWKEADGGERPRQDRRGRQRHAGLQRDAERAKKKTT